jgi:hypothetical protein
MFGIAWVVMDCGNVNRWMFGCLVLRGLLWAWENVNRWVFGCLVLRGLLWAWGNLPALAISSSSGLTP